MNFSQATFGELSSNSFLVLSSESFKANVSFSLNSVNLSEKCSFLIV